MCRRLVHARDVACPRDEGPLEHDVPVEAFETGGGCHLDARQVAVSIDALDLAGTDLLFIENVGNLVCPSSFDLGETLKVVLMSVTEGEDKLLEYPSAFRRAGALVLTKVDLVPYLQFSEEEVLENARSINPDLEMFSTSCFTDQGLEAWAAWLADRAAAAKERARRDR